MSWSYHRYRVICLAPNGLPTAPQMGTDYKWIDRSFSSRPAADARAEAMRAEHVADGVQVAVAPPYPEWWPYERKY